MRKHRSRFIVVIVAVVGVLSVVTVGYATSRAPAKAGAAQGLVPQKAVAPAATHACGSKKANEADGATTGNSTTSTSFVDVPDMSVTFSVRNAGCAIVDFAAWAFAPGGTDELMMVQAVVGATPCAPGEYQFAGDDNTLAASHAANFECPLTSGSNTIKIQFRSFFGGSVTMHRRSMYVLHGA
jgi:hypothetical protein